MARKSKGYVKLEWTCPNCETRNPGPKKSCTNCGSPQPENVVFEKAAHDQVITNENEIAQAKKGADIHCPYCGTRNPSGTKICSQCGGDLSEGKLRASGQILGAFEGEKRALICPNCSTENSADAKKCISCNAPLTLDRESNKFNQKTRTQKTVRGKKISPVFFIVPIIVLLIICVLFAIKITKKSDVVARVESIHWYREIHIEAFGPVNFQKWESEIPFDAETISCSPKYKYTSEELVPSSTEVCGTPYVVDDGSGYGEVVEDCVYDVYENWCSYSINEWYIADTLSLEGDDRFPKWPDMDLNSNQREGEKVEFYKIQFRDESSDAYSYTTNSFDDYAQFEINSRWVLTVNGINAITYIEPAD